MMNWKFVKYGIEVRDFDHRGGHYFDCYHPNPDKTPYGIWKHLMVEKVEKEQAYRFVINLDTWTDEFIVLENYFKNGLIDGLEEIITVRNGVITKLNLY
ncbi:MAG: hypothetical protein IPO14_06320 [Saprospiraceae bacterium]|jgi:hypothetical protein|nr:hypothetical protein [Saprospiraceae bacterium]